MARIFKIKELEAKKRALAEESDLYRQSLRFEVHNLRLHAAWSKRRLTTLTFSPLWALLPPLLNYFISKKKRRSSKWRIFSTALAGWQLYRKFSGFIPRFFPGLRRRTDSSEEERAPAATI
jgi:hypothetical protein